MLSLPSRTVPASLSRVMIVASLSGMFSPRMVEPLVVRMPAVSNWSLTATGTPWRGPRRLPAAISASALRASSRARSGVTVMYEA